MGDGRVFFVDYGLGKGRAIALRHRNVDARFHTDASVSMDALDVNWIRKVSKKRWIILTKNHRMVEIPEELAVILESRARIFTLTDSQMKGDRMDEAFTAVWPVIEDFLDSPSNSEPFFVRVLTDPPRLEPVTLPERLPQATE